jgi:hypothetical protein
MERGGQTYAAKVMYLDKKGTCNKKENLMTKEKCG